MILDTLSPYQIYFVRAYEYICLIVTILLVGYSIFVYVQNHDITKIGNKKYHSTSKDVYPSISVCFGDVLDSKKLEAWGTNKTSYTSFLQGKIWSKLLLEVNFEGGVAVAFNTVRNARALSTIEESQEII